MIDFNYKLSIGHHNKSYGFENNNKYRQKPKTQKKVREEIAETL